MAIKFFLFVFFLLKDCAKKLELRSFNLIGMCTQGGEHSDIAYGGLHRLSKE